MREGGERKRGGEEKKKKQERRERGRGREQGRQGREKTVEWGGGRREKREHVKGGKSHPVPRLGTRTRHQTLVRSSRLPVGLPREDGAGVRWHLVRVRMDPPQWCGWLACKTPIRWDGRL